MYVLCVCVYIVFFLLLLLLFKFVFEQVYLFVQYIAILLLRSLYVPFLHHHVTVDSPESARCDKTTKCNQIKL